MNPFQRAKVDISSLTEEEQKAFRMYGKLPNRKDIMQNKLKERKYFDSGDYALSKAGKTSEISPTDVGSEHPVPENIPHASPSASTSAPGTGERGGSISGPSGGVGPVLSPSVSAGGHAGSPVKDPSWLNREQSIDDQPGTSGDEEGETGGAQGKREGVPIRGRPGGS